jgi:glutamate racemase
VNGARTDTIVLACTHYPFLIRQLEHLAPWPVEWIDPAPAIARRVISVMNEAGGGEGTATRGRAYLTSGKPWPVALVHTLRHLGLEPENVTTVGA